MFVVLKEVVDDMGVVDVEEVVDDAVVVVAGAGVVVVIKCVVVGDGVVVVVKGVVVGDGVVVVVKGVVAGDGVVVIKEVVVGGGSGVEDIKEVVDDAVVVVAAEGEVVVVTAGLEGTGVVVMEEVVVTEVLEGTGVVVMEEVVILAAVDVDPFALDENEAGVDTTGTGDVEFVPFPPPPPECELASRRILRTWRASVPAVTTLLTCAPDTLSSNTNSTASASVHATHDHHRNLFTFLCFLGMPRRIH